MVILDSAVNNLYGSLTDHARKIGTILNSNSAIRAYRAPSTSETESHGRFGNTPEKGGSSIFSSASEQPEWEFVKLTNRRSPTSDNKHQSLYKNRKQANMPTLKPRNSFPVGIFDQHFKNEREAKAEIQADLLKVKETEEGKENQQPSSLSAAVSVGKGKISDYFTQRKPMGRGGGMGLDNNEKLVTGMTTTASNLNLLIQEH